MTIARTDTLVKRLAEALGIGECHEATIRLAAGELVTITTKRFVLDRDCDAIADVIREEKYALVRAAGSSWIPLDERLPPKNLEVLIRGVHDGVSSVYIGHLGFRGWSIKSGRERGYSWAPTHWMTVPEVTA
jgi:hypothetical protein